MRFTLLCLAVSLVAICAAIQTDTRSSRQLQKRSTSSAHLQDDPNNVFGDDVQVKDFWLPGPSTEPPSTTEPPTPPSTQPPTPPPTQPPTPPSTQPPTPPPTQPPTPPSTQPPTPPSTQPPTPPPTQPSTQPPTPPPTQPPTPPPTPPSTQPPAPAPTQPPTPPPTQPPTTQPPSSTSSSMVTTRPPPRPVTYWPYPPPPPPNNFWPSPTYYPTYYPSPQPTTTADPMCPQGKAGPCRELPLGKIGGITFQNNAWATLQFFVDYKVRNRKIKKESGAMTIWMKKTIDLPTDAEDILLTIQNVAGPSEIFKRQFKYPVIRCYATTDAVQVPQVGCA